MKIAIQHDFVRQPNGEEQSFSGRWAVLAEAAGIAVRWVDVFDPDIIEQVRGCDGFLWRFGYDLRARRMAHGLLPAIEKGLGIPVFPDWNTAWHFEDKVAQAYLLQAHGFPVPRTWTFWKEADALAFCQGATYPFVIKLSAGIRSNNVLLAHDAAQAQAIVHRLFSEGIETLHPEPIGWRERVKRDPALRRLIGRPQRGEPRESGYFYAQEFLADNDFDTRITVIGGRVYAFRRFNRDGDFRASGSGKVDWDPEAIDQRAVRLALKVADALRTQCVAIDFMYRGDTCLVGEISYTFAAWGIRDCPGHWRLSGDPDSGTLHWCEGSLRAEDAIFQDFLTRLPGAELLAKSA